MKNYIFGNVCTCFFHGVDKLLKDNPTKKFFLVQVCNSNRTGIQTDYGWSTVKPEWAWVQDYFKDHDEKKYTRKYNAMLDQRAMAIQEEWEVIKDLAKGKTIVLVCHEATGFCHRHLLLQWLFEEGLIRAILNRDAVMCATCYEQYNLFEKEEENNAIMGYCYNSGCDDCEA